MAIKIVRNAAGNCINFQGSSNPVYWNACLSGEVSTEDTSTVNVINDIRSLTSPTTVYEFYQIPYTDFVDADGNAFATAQDCADYITAQANVAGNTGTFILAGTDTLDFQVDSTGTTILLDNGDAFAANSIQAAGNSSGYIDIVKHTTGSVLYQDLRLANATINGTQVTQVLATAVNELNATFAQSGSDTGNVPVITSSLTAAIVEGETLNYELTADYGVGYEFSNLPSGVVTVQGKPRKLVGGSGVAAGTYNITMKAINYYGEDSETLVLTVSSPPFADTKSVSFNQNDYATAASPSALSTVLGRASNGSGSGDAWSMSVWLKCGTHTGGSKQTILFFGDTDYDNGGHIWLYYKGSDKSLTLQYGSKNNNLEFKSANNVFTSNTWHHILVTYDGGTTGSASGSVSSYYSRFNLYVDGSLLSTTNSNDNYGWSSGVDTDYLYLGKRRPNNDWMKNATKVDELAFWGSDESSNVAAIYNSGATHDLSALGSAPLHWWRMGDGDTYPTLQDTVGSVDLTMTNMTVAEIVSDVP